MDKDDVEKEFNSLTERLTELQSPEIAIDVLSLSRVVERLNEAALYLGKFVSKVVAQPRGTPVEFPDVLIQILPPLAHLCEETVDQLHDFVCEECMGGCDICEDPECEGCGPEETS